MTMTSGNEESTPVDVDVESQHKSELDPASEEISSKNIVSTADWTFNLSKTAKFIICFAGLQISYVSWGVVQEKIMTMNYSFGKFTSSAVTLLLFLIVLFT